MNYPELIAELRPTAMLWNEIGVFAVCSIPKDAVIFPSSAIAETHPLSWSEWKELDFNTRQKLFGFCPGTPEGFIAPPNLNHLSVPWFTNHSCDPNSAYNAAGDLIAIRNIEIDEEILWDYGTLERNPNFIMNCECKCDNCRGVITGTPNNPEREELL